MNKSVAAAIVAVPDAQDTVLLVEDQAIIALSESERIRRFGYDVCVAYNGEEAVRIAGSDPTISLVLMDIDLGPGIDGPTAAAKILEIRQVPIVFLTAHAEREYVERVRAITRYGYVLKESGDFVLRSSIEMALQLFRAHQQISEHRSGSVGRNSADGSDDVSDYEVVFQSTQDAMFLMDIHDGDQFTCRRVNHAYEAQTGIDPTTILGKTPQQILGTVAGDRICDNYRRCIAEGAPIQYRETLSMPLGTKTWSTVLTPVYRDGRVRQIVGASRDITNEIRTSDQLLVSRRKLDLAMVAAKMAAWEFDAESGRVSVDAGMREILGRSTEGLEGPAAFREIVNAEDLKTAIDTFHATLANGDDRFQVLLRVLTPEGELRSLHVHGVRLPPEAVTDGAVGDGLPWSRTAGVRFVGIAVDVTAHRQREEQISELVAEKDMILHEVHHRIKNNLSVIASLLSLQASTLESRNRRAAEAISDAHSRLKSVALLYDRLFGARQFDELSVSVYLSALVDDTFATLPHRAGIVLQKEFDDFPLRERQLTLIGIIVNELITNALKYAFVGRSEGTIVITAKKHDHEVTLSVADNGVGLPEDVRLERANGFGFLVVGTLARQMNARVRVERDEGTRFVLEFSVA